MFRIANDAVVQEMNAPVVRTFARRRRLTPLRRIVQGATLLLFIAIPFLNLSGINFVTGTLYSMAIGSLTMSDPLVVVQHVLAAKELFVPLLLSAIIPVLLALALGPVFCGWMCPQGFISEMVEAVRQRMKPRANSRDAPRKGALWVKMKWLILIVGLVGAGLFSLPLFNYISAPGIITMQIANAVFLGSVGPELVLIAAILGFEILWFRRGWCKVVCPIGSALIAMKTPATLRIEHDQGHRCNTNACGVACVTSCQLAIDPRISKQMWLCTNCAACIDACPDDALGWRFLSKV